MTSLPARPPRPLADRTSARPSVLRAAALALVALAAGGCTTTETVRYGEVTAVPGPYAPIPAPLSIGEIAAELRAGRVQADLAADIRERGLLAPATSADIDLLQQQGAGNEVVEAVRNESDEMLRAVPPVVVTPAPVTVVPGYGWYPWVPFSFGLWWYDWPAYRRPPPSWRPPPPGTHPPPPPAARPLPIPRSSQPVKPSR